MSEIFEDNDLPMSDTYGLSEPAFTVKKMGSAFSWTREHGMRVTSPAGLVLPPWTLGVEGEAAGIEFDWWRFEYVQTPPADPNAADGAWGELAFLPHVKAVYRPDSDERAVVPLYLSPAEAIARPDLCKMPAPEMVPGVDP